LGVAGLVLALGCGDETVTEETTSSSAGVGGGSSVTSTGAGGSSSASWGVGGGSTAVFHIRFDYRFDTKGMFDPPERRAALEGAAAAWSAVLAEDFEDIPAGTAVLTRDPENPGDPGMVFPIEEPIDDLVVFVGFTNHDGPGGQLASSFPSAAIGSVSDPALSAALDERHKGSDFEPWTGWISFDESEDWFFDATPGDDGDLPAADIDFYSVALHELGHLLGFGTADAYFALVDGSNAFIGSEAAAANGGPVPLSGDGGHIVLGLTSDGRRPLMDSSDAPGERSVITSLDEAMMVDLGHVFAP
jgi:hypothetical protein